MLTNERKSLGELLIEAELVTKDQLDDALLQQKLTGRKLGEILTESNLVSERKILEVLEFQLQVPLVELGQFEFDNEAPLLINEAMARRYQIIPINRENNQLVLAMTDPLNLQAIDDVRLFTGMGVKPVLALNSEINSQIDRFYSKEGAERAVEDIGKEIGIEQITEQDLEQLSEINNAPVVRLVNSVIQHAVRVRASDIHIEPFEASLRIRFRVDGELQEIMKTSKAAHPAIVTRIKIMSKLDIAEKRLPQDGRIEMSVEGKDVDLRVSVLPTVYGEKIVMRILGRSDMLMSKTQLGFSDENVVLFDRIIRSSNGIILVTGPTGSGKTTTLYAVLRELNKINRNVITVEDPVEYRLEGINQVQVNVKAGLTFANGLRSILRQDPDIIMIGEIRDAETAQIAVRAAITGHLVLATVHTNDTASTITRLIDMGIEPYLVSSSIVGITAQRLVRRICSNCKTAYIPDRVEMEILKIREPITLYRGSGCSACNYTGYRSRIAIHEIMPVNAQIRELIDKKASIDHVRGIAIRQGMTTLRDNSTSLVLKGVTTTEELLKVTYSVE
ncbi:MAG: type II secretion system ATPase GspE [Eubacteriales bacterium]|nr:type II secretion system ATPase GspE [Eubacteriales bacterium]